MGVGIGAEAGVGVRVGVGVGMEAGVGVRVGVEADVGIGVGTEAGVGVRVGVKAGVGVGVGTEAGVGVRVGVETGAGVGGALSQATNAIINAASKMVGITMWESIIVLLLIATGSPSSRLRCPMQWPQLARVRAELWPRKDTTLHGLLLT